MELHQLAHRFRHRQLHRGVEAVLLVSEELVERRPRDVGPTDDVRDRRRAETLGRAALRHRAEDPFALRVGDQRLGQRVATGRQALTVEQTAEFLGG